MLYFDEVISSWACSTSMRSFGLKRTAARSRGCGCAIKLCFVPMAEALSRTVSDAYRRVISGIRQRQVRRPLGAPRAREEGLMTAVADSKPRIAPGPLALPVLGNPVWALRRDLHNVMHHHWRSMATSFVSRSARELRTSLRGLNMSST